MIHNTRLQSLNLYFKINMKHEDTPSSAFIATIMEWPPGSKSLSISPSVKYSDHYYYMDCY